MHYVIQPEPGRKGRIAKPWFRASTQSWYVTLDGRQVCLGRDQSEAQTAFNEIMKKLRRRPRKIAFSLRQGRKPEYIYFIQDVETKNIKIGITYYPKKRLASLQSGNANELVLLGAIRGLPGDEMALLAEFKDLLIRGEWFRFDPHIISVMDELLEEYEPYRE